MKKTLLIFVLLILVLVGCKKTDNNKIVQQVESVDLPYVMYDEDLGKTDKNGNPMKNDVVIQSITVRDLTTDENESYLRLIKNSKTIDLNSEWYLVEVDFGTGSLSEGATESELFKEPKIVHGSDIVYEVKYNRNIYKLTLLEEVKNANYFTYSQYIYQYLVPRQYIEPGAQLRYDNNVYLDLEVGE